MKYTELPLNGAYLVEIEPIEDERGYFARTWSRQEFIDLGFEPEFIQYSISHNHKKGTLRGMHFQIAPFEEMKVVQCTQGSIFDVIIDLCPESATYGQWTGVELSADNRRMLYIPKCFAHGFQTLEDNTDVSYRIANHYSPDHARGYRYDDPAFGIEWPLPVSVISERDRKYSPFKMGAVV
ncbi:MAG TPA: dTDP-4-dehydrorhamnose 3,5-epimerase [Coleofasciculaceae cyanobacterium]|jgi:dTDP-4-dehydrorhamnose 3,5-epimerase